MEEPVVKPRWTPGFLHRLITGLVGIAACFGIYELDHFAGTDLGLSLFYLIVVVSVSVIGGTRVGIAISIVGAFAWFAGDLEDFPLRPMANKIWLGVVRFSTFLFAAVTIGWLMNLKRRAEGLNQQLNEMLKRETDFARTDALTGLANSRQFYETLRTEIARARRDSKPLAVMYLDLDNFKKINDTFGHARGDEALRGVAAIIRDALREGDVAARLGGDEFAAVLWDADDGSGRVAAARVIEQVKAFAAQFPGTGFGATAGVAPLEDGLDVEGLIHRADETMYKAKAAGKGTVHVWGAG